MPGFLKIANKRLFKRNHGIVTDVASAVSGDETNSSEDESMANPLKYMKSLVMNKVKTNPRID